MSSGIEVGSIKMKIYNWVFTLTFSRSLNKMARIIGVTPMTDSTRLRARAGTRHISHRKHAPFPLFSSSWHPLFRLSLSYLFLFSCCIFLIFSFLFFSFSLAYPPVLFIHPSFFHFVRWILFNQNLQFLFVIPTICISFSFTIFICQMIFQSILKIFHRVINVYYSD